MQRLPKLVQVPNCDPTFFSALSKFYHHTLFTLTLKRRAKKRLILKKGKERMEEKGKEEKDSVYKFKKELGGVIYAASIINLA